MRLDCATVQESFVTPPAFAPAADGRHVCAPAPHTAGSAPEAGSLVIIRNPRPLASRANLQPTPQPPKLSARATRYKAKRMANRLLPKNHRARYCMTQTAPNAEGISLHMGSEGRAFYSGLRVCGSVWACPVCASKISERRKAEVQTAMATAKMKGWKVVLVTLTVSHSRHSDVSFLAENVPKAFGRMLSSRSGENLRHSLGLKGHIRALETTMGSNGFHPHLHVLMFIDSNLSADKVHELVSPLWQKAAVRCGLSEPSLDRGCRVDDGSKAAAYVAKTSWGLDSELTKSQVKKGKKGSLSMMDLLLMAEAGDQLAGKAWLQYINAFQGKRQLVWSQGLKKLLVIEEKSDEQIAEEKTDEESRVVAVISPNAWKGVRLLQAEEKLLYLAETDPDLLHLILGQIVEESLLADSEFHRPSNHQ